MPEIPADLKSALANRYAIERVVGRGGMATVYLAHDVKHNRQVAVKVLRPEIVATLGVDRIRITESAGVHSLLTGIGVAAATVGTLLLLETSGLEAPLAIALASVGAACCAYGFTARALLRRFKGRRQQILWKLLERISQHVAGADKQLGPGPTYKTEEP